MSHLPEASDDYLAGTRFNHRSANRALNNRDYAGAYRHSMECVENALKRILEKNRWYRRSDRHHQSEMLWDKIQENNLISTTDQQILNSILPDLFKVDIVSQTEHTDCASAQIGDFRYRDMDDFIDFHDAKRKVDLINQAMNILDKYLE